MTPTSKELSPTAQAETKHTPGPWKVGKFIGTGVPQLEISSDESLFWVAGVGTKSTPSGEGWANAYLIAAAPELLEALKAMTRLTEVLADDTTEEEVGYGGKTVRENIHDAKAVIAKAEKQP